ncbi:MAG: hypothetical protein A2X13_14740 [Bacteroidetes bacterium GWC2_33_15]|nr:MAG: hypothetical protein A2X10_06805 [Bacteroidetes bacterium GWA2_33_15]OFX50130.1 MAG: hypothetical protein A2X13_14740 [Bacteroidetes bacterium GWC2_33_15]OFX65283.1 MAG: hypothetical protein A2X15_04315 [Bacteroidetes bacterium GWB2_32_14]OFX70509.1 MAG: hypothetical protein A2X14_04370 [Bacteroidetes bacterium GWD2_33_33]HAN19618.1 hypothetical protein [Bacteroidales bacterium]
MRYPNGIEIYIDKSKLTDEQFAYLQENYDVELYAAKNEFTLWIHDDGYKPFQTELFQYLGAAKGCFNNRTKQDHLDLFIEAIEIDEFGIEINGVKYKNLTFTEILKGVDLSKVIFKRELYNLYN